MVILWRMATYKAFKPISKANPNITPQDKIKCLPSFYEYISIRGSMVNTNLESAGGATDYGNLYTVPAGYTLFITSAGISAKAGEDNSYIGMSLTRDNSVGLPYFLEVPAVAGCTCNVSFNIPIKINSGEEVVYYSNYNSSCFYFVGFIIDNQILNEILKDFI